MRCRGCAPGHFYVSDLPPAASSPGKPRSAGPVATRSGTSAISRIPNPRTGRRFFRNSSSCHRTRKPHPTRGKPTSQVTDYPGLLLQQTLRNQVRGVARAPNSPASQRCSPESTGRPTPGPTPASHPLTRRADPYGLGVRTPYKSKDLASQHDWMVANRWRNEQSWVPNVYRRDRAPGSARYSAPQRLSLSGRLPHPAPAIAQPRTPATHPSLPHLGHPRRAYYTAHRAPIAQLVELRTFNPQVVGSSPTGGTPRAPGLYRAPVLVPRAGTGTAPGQRARSRIPHTRSKHSLTVSASRTIPGHPSTRRSR